MTTPDPTVLVAQVLSANSRRPYSPTDDARDILAALAHRGLLVTPEVAAVVEAARALTAEDLELAAITDEWVAQYNALAAAVDALEARPHPDTTGAAG